MNWPEFIDKPVLESVDDLDIIPREDYEVTEYWGGLPLIAYANRTHLDVLGIDQEPEEIHWSAVSEILDALSFYGGNYAVYGEYLSVREFLVSDVWNINTQSYMFPDERVEFLNELNNEVGGQIQQADHCIDWTPSLTESDAVVKQKIHDLARSVSESNKLVFKSYQSTTRFKGW